MNLRPERITIRVGPLWICLRFPPQPIPLAKDGWPRRHQDFADAVLAARLAANKTQAELANELKVTETTIANIETGRSKPLAQTRVWLVKALAKFGQTYPPKPKPNP